MCSTELSHTEHAHSCNQHPGRASERVSPPPTACSHYSPGPPPPDSKQDSLYFLPSITQHLLSLWLWLRATCVKSTHTRVCVGGCSFLWQRSTPRRDRVPIRSPSLLSMAIWIAPWCGCYESCHREQSSVCPWASTSVFLVGARLGMNWRVGQSVYVPPQQTPPGCSKVGVPVTLPPAG